MAALKGSPPHCSTDTIENAGVGRGAAFSCAALGAWAGALAQAVSAIAMASPEQRRKTRFRSPRASAKLRRLNHINTAMPDIHIERNHTLGLAKARKVAFAWAEQAENEFDMSCTYAEGKTEDEVTFKRSGVNGTLVVTKDQFVLDAKLGFLVGAFKDKIQGEIEKNLDQLLGGAQAKSATKKSPPK
jgi:putative polyhydroxyalkanoate system protein